MVQQLLIPGVQHGQEADFRAEVPWIGCDLEQRLRSRMGQQPVHQLRVL